MVKQADYKFPRNKCANFSDTIGKLLLSTKTVSKKGHYSQHDLCKVCATQPCAHTRGRYLLFMADCQHTESGKEWVGYFHGHVVTPPSTVTVTTTVSNMCLLCYA